MQHSNWKHMEAETLSSCACWLTIATTCFSRGDKRVSCGWVGWGRSRKWALGEEGSTFRKQTGRERMSVNREISFIILAFEVRWGFVKRHCGLWKMVKRRNQYSRNGNKARPAKRENLTWENIFAFQVCKRNVTCRIECKSLLIPH